MLRITKLVDRHGETVLKLEGELVGQWVRLLRRTCSEHQEEIGSSLVLDLSDVGFADTHGTELLRQLEIEGVQCVAWSQFLKKLVQNAP